MLVKISLTLLILMSITVKSQDLSDTTALDNRVKELISKFTIDEKIQTLTAGIKDGIPRLNIPEYLWANECLHGLIGNNITVFPQSIALAATWNTKTIHRVASAISDEARARFPTGINGLNFWSPNINIARDPRWGRNQETYGEDPYLTSRMAVSYIKGLQGDDPKYFKTISSPKHFFAHSGPESKRHIFDAKVGMRDLRETYMPAFKAAITEGGAYSIMTAYNSLNGRPISASTFWLQDILRKEWGFKGYVTTDCNAIGDSYWGHHVGINILEGTAIPLQSGVDLECGDMFRFHLKNAYNEGYITEKEIENATFRLYKAKFLLGLYDHPDSVKYNKIPSSVIDSKEHNEIALEAAKEAIVLLKNDGTLPLRKNLNKLLVVGPSADGYYQNLGSYAGWPSNPVTILNGIKKVVSPETVVDYRKETEIAGFLTELVTPLNVRTVDGIPGLLGEYFTNKSMSGLPFKTRIDSIIDFEWTYKEPIAGVNPDSFSVRWSGIIRVDEPGEYTFKVTSDDGTKLVINDTVVIDDYVPHGNITRTGRFVFEANKDYNLTLEYLQAWDRSSVRFEFGNKNTGANQMKNLEAIAKDYDAIIYVGGLTHDHENEELNFVMDGFYRGDRTNIEMPLCQQKIIEALHNSGKPVVMVNLGTSMALNWHNDNIPAILQVWYLAQTAGDAVASVLFGDYNPGGRTPVTFYKSINDLPEFENYDMAGRTYRYFKGKPLYPFGFGLSYTTFDYPYMKLPQKVIKMCEQNTAPIVYQITNTGNYDGDEVVQLYVRYLNSRLSQPNLQLKGFKRIHLKKGETITDTLHLNLSELYSFDPELNNYIHESGKYEIMLGYSSQDYRHTGIIDIDNCIPDTHVVPISDDIIKVYPNPANDVVKIELDHNNSEPVDFCIYDNLGSEMQVNIYPDIMSNIFNFDCSAFSNGVYTIAIRMKYQTIFKRLIIMK